MVTLLYYLYGLMIWGRCSFGAGLQHSYFSNLAHCYGYDYDYGYGYFDYFDYFDSASSLYHLHFYNDSNFDYC